MLPILDCKHYTNYSHPSERPSSTKYLVTYMVMQCAGVDAYTASYLMVHRRATRIFSRRRDLKAHSYVAGNDVTTAILENIRFAFDETLTNETREGRCVGFTDITPHVSILSLCVLVQSYEFVLYTVHACKERGTRHAWHVLWHSEGQIYFRWSMRLCANS